jgi:hypothetical protein
MLKIFDKRGVQQKGRDMAAKTKERHHTTRARLLAAVTAAAVGALAVGSSSSARVPIPEEPEVTIGKRVKVEKVAPVRSFVPLGTSNRFGLELFATTRDGRSVGIPMG